jgi:hypothetical protein
MKPIAFEEGAVEIDARMVAEGLGIDPAVLRARMREGRITGRSERGIDADEGRYRLTFFSEHRRFRVIIDERGAIIQRSSVDFGQRPLPPSAHRPGD